MSKDYYEVLGLQKNASQEEIKRAYKQMAKKFHPDVSSEADAETRFKEVQEAYGVLGDETKRRNYDQFGSAGEKFSGFGGFNYGDFSHAEFDFEDLFSGMGFSGFGDLFGSRQRKNRPQKGQDLIFKLSISFMEAVFGTTKEIELNRIEKCDSCNGQGGTGKKTCSICKGKGMETRTRRTILGLMQTSSTCSNCGGEGTIISNPCNKCNGSGLMNKKRKIKISIPEGIDSGNHLRMQNQGNYNKGGTGDLFIVILVEPHEIFKRDKADIFIEIPISFSEAVLGEEIKVPTVKGKARLKIPSGTQTGTIFKMNKQGIKNIGSEKRGDQYVKVFLKTPEKLSKKQKELFEELKNEETLRKKRKGFFEKVKDKFN
jgi:molecular chaperone DnaJ